MEELLPFVYSFASLESWTPHKMFSSATGSVVVSWCRHCLQIFASGHSGPLFSNSVEIIISICCAQVLLPHEHSFETQILREFNTQNPTNDGVVMRGSHDRSTGSLWKSLSNIPVGLTAV